MPDYVTSTEELKSKVIQFRRDLHRIPELDSDLPKTTAYLMDYLSKLPCEITKIGKASFTAFFDAGFDSAIAFRTDMDALPIEEVPAHEFCSIHKGNMHACGHDGHMSIMLGFASEVSKLLDSDKDEIPENKKIKKNVLLVFQAAEETTGGALEICESGLFEKHNTEKIFGLHIWPGFPRNTVICRKGPFMAGTKVLWLDVKGKSSHIAKPDEGIDALDVGTRLVQRIYKMNREEFPENVSRILKFGEFKSGTGVNILSSRTKIGGTSRFYDHDILKKMLERIDEISKSLEDEYGCEIDFSHSRGYPPVINPDELVDELEATVLGMSSSQEEDIPTFLPLNKPLMTAEDFADYQQRLPGLFFFLGTGKDLALHNGNYDIDEEVLPIGVKIFEALLLNS